MSSRQANAQSSGDSTAQVEEVRSESLVAAFGVNLGYAGAPEQRGILTEAYYDVPIAALYFSPGVRILLSPNSMFSIDVRLRAQLWGGSTTGSTQGFFAAGGSVMVWEDRASFGAPVDFTVAIPIVHRLQFNIGVNATPHFFLGPEKDAVMFGIFAGLRSPVL